MDFETEPGSDQGYPTTPDDLAETGQPEAFLPFLIGALGSLLSSIGPGIATVLTPRIGSGAAGTIGGALGAIPGLVGGGLGTLGAGGGLAGGLSSIPVLGGLGGMTPTGLAAGSAAEGLLAALPSLAGGEGAIATALPSLGAEGGLMSGAGELGGLVGETIATPFEGLADLAGFGGSGSGSGAVGGEAVAGEAAAGEAAAAKAAAADAAVGSAPADLASAEAALAEAKAAGAGAAEIEALTTGTQYGVEGGLIGPAEAAPGGLGDIFREAVTYVAELPGDALGWAAENPLEAIMLGYGGQELLGSDDMGGYDGDYGESYEGEPSGGSRYDSGGSAVFPDSPSPTGVEFDYFPEERIG